VHTCAAADAVTRLHAVREHQSQSDLGRHKPVVTLGCAGTPDDGGIQTVRPFDIICSQGPTADAFMMQDGCGWRRAKSPPAVSSCDTDGYEAGSTLSMTTRLAVSSIVTP
jgi:hypothetical protein